MLATFFAITLKMEQTMILRILIGSTMMLFSIRHLMLLLLMAFGHHLNLWPFLMMIANLTISCMMELRMTRVYETVVSIFKP